MKLQGYPLSDLSASSFTYPSRLVLTGFMGAGKTTIGRLLAQRIGHQFVDTDKRILQKTGRPHSDVFETEGEVGFRRWEREALLECLAEQSIVIATGGGALVQQKNLTDCLEQSLVVYLCAPIDELYERVIFSPKDRPLVNVTNSQQVFKDTFAKREPFYIQAPLHIETQGLTAKEVARRIDDAVQANPHLYEHLGSDQ